jgi:predicted RNA-binding protein YlqC (UPF0109 family)
MKDLLKWTISNLVDQPDQVEITEKTDGDFTIYSITVAPDDMGKIIGKEGKIIKSLRHLIRIPAIKQRKKVTLALVENSEFRMGS